MGSVRWRLEIARRAHRDIANLPSLVRRRILGSFEGLTATPRTGDIKKLAAADNDYRLRVGDYRVLFTVHGHERTVEITGIRHQSSAYER